MNANAQMNLNPNEMNPQALIQAVLTMQAQVVAMSALLEEVRKQNQMTNLHLSMMYSAKTIEETLDVMSNLGKEALHSDCTVYSVEGDMIFSVGENNERNYLSLEEGTVIKQAIDSKAVVVDNSLEGHGNAVGDQKENTYVKNVMAVPLEDQYGDVLGVVVAKDKNNGMDGFNQEDAKLFDLKEGMLGAAFRIGMEKKALLQESTIDELTRLQNRNGMNRFLENAVLDKTVKHEPVSVILMDIDHFKRFNDTYGHDIGDKCLRQVADTLRNNLRITSDSGIFRWGGEEMVAVLPVDEVKAFEIAERLRHAVEETPLVVNEKTGESTQITVSAGISSFAPKDVYALNRNNINEEFDKCFKVADNNLYQAKENGRNRTYGSDELMKSHYSAPSPTVLMKNYLDSIGLELNKDKDGYILYDGVNEEVLRRDMQSSAELVKYLESSDILKVSIFKDLKSEYPKGEYIQTDATLKDWSDLLNDRTAQKTPAVVEFMKDNAEDIATIQAFANHVSEIKLDNVVTNFLDVEKEAVKETSEKERPKTKQKTAVERGD